MRDSYNTAEVNASNPFLGTCKRCASPDLFIKAQGPHFGLFCGQCQLWQKWVRRSEVRRWQASNVAQRETFTEHSVSTQGLKTFEDEPTDLAAEIADLRNVISAHDIQLRILTKAILNAGWLKGRKSPPAVDVDDKLVDRLVGELAGDGAR